MFIILDHVNYIFYALYLNNHHNLFYHFIRYRIILLAELHLIYGHRILGHEVLLLIHDMLYYLYCLGRIMKMLILFLVIDLMTVLLFSSLGLLNFVGMFAFYGKFGSAFFLN
jgi:hypothetical protein